MAKASAIFFYLLLLSVSYLYRFCPNMRYFCILKMPYPSVRASAVFRFKFILPQLQTSWYFNSSTHGILLSGSARWMRLLMCRCTRGNAIFWENKERNENWITVSDRSDYFRFAALPSTRSIVDFLILHVLLSTEFIVSVVSDRFRTKYNNKYTIAVVAASLLPRIKSSP